MHDDTAPWLVDWNLWREQWAVWFTAHALQMSDPCRCRVSRVRASIAADAVLGYWHVDGRCVELSEVRYELGSPMTRHVGVTWLDSVGDGRTAELADTAAELTELLFHG